jgi:hypothetical protein
VTVASPPACVPNCSNNSNVCSGTAYLDPVCSTTCIGTKDCSCPPSNACAQNTCIGSTCSDGCGGTVQGAKDCRDENWQEVSPN